jgi:hypothetical protein
MNPRRARLNAAIENAVVTGSTSAASIKRKASFNASIGANVGERVQAKKPRTVAGSWWTGLSPEEFYTKLKAEQARMQPANTSETKGTI